MQFGHIPGQEKVKQSLIEAVNSNTIPHAQLFTGPKGFPGLAMALAYVTYISCINRSGTDACGECASCKKMAGLQHPDLHFSFPFMIADGKETSDAYLNEWRDMVKNRGPFFAHEDWVSGIKGEGKNLLMTVAEASSISKKLWLKSYEGGFKFLIIWEPEAMREDASNKLLKLVEEPPDRTAIILVTEHPENVIATIRSRTQQVRLDPLTEDQIKDFLVNNYKIDPNAASLVVERSGTDLSRAARLAIQGGETTWFPVFRDWMRMCYSLDVKGLIQWVDTFSKDYGREEQRGFLIYSLDMVRQCLSSNYTGGELQRFSADEMDFSRKFSPFINEQNALDFMDVFQRASRDVSFNLSPKPLFFDLSIELHKLLRKGKRA